MKIQQIVATPSDELFVVIDGALWKYGRQFPGFYVDSKTGDCMVYPRQWTNVELPEH